MDGRALPGIQVSVSGLARGATTDTAGRFTIVNVPAGTHMVQARGIDLQRDWPRSIQVRSVRVHLACGVLHVIRLA